MKIFKTYESLQNHLDKFRSENKKIGFVPTLGALHIGHGSLITKSVKKTDITVCSIFVNPTQFNQASDLAKYPRTYDADVALLEKFNCDILFFPATETVYPKGTDDRPNIDLNGLDKVLEGSFRPGHFDGVVQVVKRLLELVKPDYLFMGQKDFQQFTIVQYMLDYFKMPVELVVCPIKRESSGLAMSSRNTRLTIENRAAASIINKTLLAAKRKIKTHSIAEIKEYAIHRLTIPNFKPEYFEIIDGRSLQIIHDASNCPYLVAVVAVWAGEIRLIDNMIFKNNSK